MWGYGPHSGFMGDWGGYGWTGTSGMLFGLIFLVVIIAVVVWLVRGGWQPDRHATVSDSRSRGLDILQERYARGEIDRDEYLKKKQDLLGG